MLNHHIIATVNQKVLSLLAKFSDQEFYEREIARRIGVSYGAANCALNELFSSRIVKRSKKGKMYFYSVNPSNAALAEFKKLVNLVLIEPLVEELKPVSDRVVLYGSCAQGSDGSQSDMDLFVESDQKERVFEIVTNFVFPKGFEDIHIQPVVKSPVELLEAQESEQAYLKEVEHGIVLWERSANER